MITTVNLPLPVGNGAGAAVDTSLLGKDKTIVVGGRLYSAVLAIEASLDGGSTWAPVTVFQVAGKRQVQVVAQFMRVVVQGRTAGTTGLNVDVSAPNNGTLLENLPLPAGLGAGPTVATGTLTRFKSIILGGAVLQTALGNSIVHVQVSEDGIDWAYFATFQNGGLQSINVAAEFMRTFVKAAPAPAGLTVDVGAELSGGGSDGSVTVQDEGIDVGDRPILNFTGAGVTATDDPVNNRIDITIPGGGAVDLDTAYHAGRIITGDAGNIEMNIAALGTTVFDSGIQLNNPTLATALLNQNTPSWVQWGSGWKTNAPAGPSPIGFAIQGRPIGGINYSEGELHFLVNPDGGGFYSMGAVDSLGFFRAQQFGGYHFVGAAGVQGMTIDAGLAIVSLQGATEVDVLAAATVAARFFPQGVAINAGLVGAPSLFVNGDVDTGIYQAAADTLSIAAGGVQAASFTAQGVGIISGAVGTPSIFVLGDTDTGIYHDGADQLSIAAGGVRAAIFTVTGVGVPMGSAAAPGLFIQGNSDTGLYSPAPNQVAIAAGGVQRMQVDTSIDFITDAAGALSVSVGVTPILSVAIQGIYVSVNGNAFTPSIGNGLDINTGFYFPGADQLAVTCGGVEQALFTTQGLGIKAGALATPGLFIIGDVNTGLYSSAVDILDVTVGGVQNARFAASSIRMPSGAVATPSYTFTADTGAGIYLNTVGANKVTTALFGADILIVAGDHVALGLAGSAAIPMLSWEADQDTGLFNQAADAIGVACGGTERARFTTQGMGTGLGAVATPPLFFLGDTNTGIYSAGVDQVDIACGGVQVGHFFSQGLAVPGGAVGTPGLSFIGDGDSGVYRVSADNVAITAGGTQIALFSSVGIGTINGTAAAPSVYFTGDADTGIYRDAANTLGLSAGGAKRAEVTTAGLGTSSGSAATPGIYFFNDSDVGFFRNAANELGISTGGTERARVDANTTASETALLLSVAGAAVQRVSVGANDSGGAGFRVLRVAN